MGKCSLLLEKRHNMDKRVGTTLLDIKQFSKARSSVLSLRLRALHTLIESHSYAPPH
jgi:hypothetical protein